MATQEAPRQPLSIQIPHSSGGYFATNNQFLKKGPKGFSEFKILDNDGGMFTRMDFPGVNKANLKFSIDEDKKSVTFEGEAPKESPYEEEGRTYVWKTMPLQCDCCHISGVTADVKLGVLRVVLQKTDASDFDGGMGEGNAAALARLSPFGRAFVKMTMEGKISTVQLGSSGHSLEQHPQVTKGSGDAFEWKRTEDGGLFVRIDMPGVGKKKAEVVVEGGTVRFSGKAKKGEHDCGGRQYSGSFSLSPQRTDLEGKITHTLKNGVLRIVIPAA
ncbi:putative 57 kDa heat shock protein [Mercurialis annua]|uniref:putative 57 kDa heat shock protein n=1 Tax=Mercurialis annua TaxID=3986 RepID=UPI00215FB47D|nr:putative 57 kDa heat shock protein [Mercurialis annua]